MLVAAKHQSFLDILILFEALPRPKFIMKKELRWAPILGLYALRIGSTPVARGDAVEGDEGRWSSMPAAPTEPRQLVIYPQGTRVAPGARPPFKVGAGVLYERLGEPCVPAATNAGVFWGRRSPYRRPGLAVVEFLRADPAGAGGPGVHGADRGRGRDASDRLMREAGFEPGRGRSACRAAAEPRSRAAGAALEARPCSRGLARSGDQRLLPMSRNFLRRALRSSAGFLPSSSPRSSPMRGADAGDRLGLVALGAAARLGDDAVDDAEGEQILGGQAQRLGRLLHLLGVLPQDRGAALGRDHRVDRMLEHGDAVGGGEGDRAARAALADDDRDDRHADLQALLGRARDRLGLAALLGALAGIGAGGVDERDRPAAPKRSARSISRIALR